MWIATIIDKLDKLGGLKPRSSVKIFRARPFDHPASKTFEETASTKPALVLT
jgi:hypothetical protein